MGRSPPVGCGGTAHSFGLSLTLENTLFKIDKDNYIDNFTDLQYICRKYTQGISPLTYI